MKLVFLFPGQGAEAVGMGRELAEAFPVARQTMEEADDALGFRISSLCFDGPEERLRLTEFTQPATFAVSMAAFRVLRERGITASLLAGHSLGEWSANCAAGTVSLADAVRTVHHRGQYMQQAVPAGQGAMAAILALPAEEVARACAETAQATGAVVSAANYNSPEQTVISGQAAAVEEAAALCRQRGARKAVLLPVSAPFHCALMKPAQERLKVDLDGLEFAPAQTPIATNADAALASAPADLKGALVRQVTGAVRWTECMRLLMAEGPDAFLEVGPGRVLCGLLRQIDRGRRCLNVEDAGSLEKTLAALAG
jgi:[acyl-carrier-protein] S-malonyltransferase